MSGIRSPRSAHYGLMYICNCNGLRRACIQAAIQGGAGDPDQVYAAHGCQMRCGRCRPEIIALLQGRRDHALSASCHGTAQVAAAA